MDTTRTAAVAANVAQAMAVKGVSQNALAEATGIPRVTLIRRLNGVTSFTVAEVEAIAAELGVDLAGLLTGNTDAKVSA